MEVRKFFKLLEYTFTGKTFPMEKLRRKETTSIVKNSDNFEDPTDKDAREQERLKDVPAAPKPETIYY